jgi:hypothetical protein
MNVEEGSPEGLSAGRKKSNKIRPFRSAQTSGQSYAGRTRREWSGRLEVAFCLYLDYVHT